MNTHAYLHAYIPQFMFSEATAGSEKAFKWIEETGLGTGPSCRQASELHQQKDIGKTSIYLEGKTERKNIEIPSVVMRDGLVVSIKSKY